VCNKDYWGIKTKQMKKITKYLKETIAELKKVSWPNKQQTIDKTALVIIVCTIVAIYIGGLDFIFTQLIKLVIN